MQSTLHTIPEEVIPKGAAFQIRCRDKSRKGFNPALTPGIAFRKIFRLFWLLAELARSLISYIFQTAATSDERGLLMRTRWQSRTAQRLLRVFGMEINTTGPLSREGLLVCNHLSYLDILAIASIAPVRFVAKREIKKWPVLGLLARLAGTIFVDREKRTQAAVASAELREALDSGSLVVLFPEGTSSGGGTVLPFKSALLEPVVENQRPITAAFINYSIAEGNVAEEICYWGDMTLVPHLFNLLGKGKITAQLSFSQIRERRGDRKSLARQLHAEVVRLKLTNSL
jgi:lyso-ornithine lipid O-acyltransferase